VCFCRIEVKEVGLAVEDCSCLALDASRIFELYWIIGGAGKGSLPPYWPARLSALSSSQKPLRLKFNGVAAQVYLSVSARLLARRLPTGVAFFRVRTVMENLGKSWNFKMVISRPGKVMEKTFKFWKSHGNLLKSHVHSHRVLNIECFLKEDAQNISRRTLSIRKMFIIVRVYTEISVCSWKFG